MTFSDAKLRAVVNLLSDPLQAHAAAHALAEEAKRRKMLVADLVAESLAPTQASAPPPPKFSDVDDDRVDVAIGKRINFNAYGLRAEVLGETGKAWRARALGGGEVWLPKSHVDRHGEDAVGRTIFVLPSWLARREGFL
jgi:hypothetical protein